MSLFQILTIIFEERVEVGICKIDMRMGTFDKNFNVKKIPPKERAFCGVECE